MTWMNRYEIEDSSLRWQHHATLGPATLTLRNLMDAVDSCSDGWPYWQKPSRAASKLMGLIEQANQSDRERYQSPRTPMPTAAEVRKAYGPIKSFRTRTGVQFDILAV